MKWFESFPVSARRVVAVDGQKILCAARTLRLSSGEKVRVVAA